LQKAVFLLGRNQDRAAVREDGIATVGLHHPFYFVDIDNAGIVKAKEVFGRQQLFVFRPVFAAHNFPPVFQKKSSVGSGGFEPNDLLQVDKLQAIGSCQGDGLGLSGGILVQVGKGDASIDALRSGLRDTTDNLSHDAFHLRVFFIRSYRDLLVHEATILSKPLPSN
jgi:hypothetical protein